MSRPAARAMLVAIVAAATLAACTSKDEDCSSGLTNCSQVCVDLATDSQNCGACFLACPAVASCSGGACRCPNPGEVVCGAECVDPATFAADPLNCGGCGIRCGFGTCASGVCQCEGGSRCEGQDPRCADLQADPANCGTCGHACEAELPGSGCEAGACACIAPRPDDCGTFCTDWSTDPANCGTDASACGNACTLAREECAGGACQCPAAFPDECPVANPTACVSLQSDPANCGTCGNVCAKTSEICSSGSCTCPPALPVPCATACVDTASDEQNCGACGNVCASGATCTGAPPRCECPAGETACGSPGTCVDTATDEQHCSGCFQACAAGHACCASACCGGTACCADGACQTEHFNGLNANYYDCSPLDQHTAEQARLAAESWSPSGTTVEFVPQCGTPFCLCRQTGSAAAIWCYAGSTMSGSVQATSGATCLTAACPFGGPPATLWH